MIRIQKLSISVYALAAITLTAPIARATNQRLEDRVAENITTALQSYKLSDEAFVKMLVGAVAPALIDCNYPMDGLAGQVTQVSARLVAALRFEAEDAASTSLPQSSRLRLSPRDRAAAQKAAVQLESTRYFKVLNGPELLTQLKERLGGENPFALRRLRQLENELEALDRKQRQLLQRAPKLLDAIFERRTAVSAKQWATKRDQTLSTWRDLQQAMSAQRSAVQGIVGSATKLLEQYPSLTPQRRGVEVRRRAAQTRAAVVIRNLRPNRDDARRPQSSL